MTAKLLNPGPVTLSERVRASLLGPDLCHREPEFAELQGEIRRRLCQVYPSDGYDAVLVAGSGTAAVEAMVGSLVPWDGRALVAVNGVYGERIAAILRLQGKTVDVAKSDVLAPIDLAAVEAQLGRARYSHVIAVHHETTTGRLNDVPALGALCRRFGVPLLLDGVSSFGGEAVDLAGWNVEAIAATANKCLHGVPGLSFVLVRRSAFAKRDSAATSLYLDLYRHHADQERGGTAFTQPVHVCHALCEALRELEDGGGWQARQARYRRLSTWVFGALAARGVKPLLAIAEPSSAALTAYRLPAGRSYADLHDAMKAAGFVIYAGQGALAQAIFRVAVMGSLDDDDVARFVAALDRHWAE